MLEQAGIRPQIIDGATEATSDVHGGHVRRPRADDVLVDDIGGGSTELVFGIGRPDARASMLARSIDVGSRRLTESLFCDSDPPTAGRVERGSQTRGRCR